MSTVAPLPNDFMDPSALYNVIDEERDRKHILQQCVHKLHENNYVTKAFGKYSKLFETIDKKGPEISICLLSEPGFGKTSTLNMILSGNPDLPMKASDRLGSGETLFCTQIKYSKEIRVTKVYCSADKYEERIMKLMKTKETEEGDETPMSTPITELSSVSSFEFEDDDEEDTDFEDSASDEANSLLLPEKLNVETSSVRLSEDHFVFLNGKSDRNELEETINFQSIHDIHNYFEKERSIDRDDILMVDRYILYYPCELLKSEYGEVILWDIPGYGEQNYSEMNSLLIEEVVSNCNVILLAMTSDRITLSLNSSSNLWKYKAFEKRKDNPPSIILTSRCPKNNPHQYSDLVNCHSTYLTQFKQNLSEFFNVDFESNPKPKKKEQEEDESKIIDFYGKYDFVVTVSNYTKNITIPHLKDTTHWKTFNDEFLNIIEIRKKIEIDNLIFKGLRYALQIVTLYRTQFPVNFQKLCKSETDKIADQTLKILIEYIQNLESNVERAISRGEKLEKKIQNSFHVGNENSLNDQIQKRLFESHTRDVMIAYYSERMKKISTRIEMFRIQLHYLLETKIVQSHDKNFDFTNFKNILSDHIDEIFHSLKVIIPNEMTDDTRMKLESYYESFKSMKGISEQSKILLETLTKSGFKNIPKTDEKELSLYEKAEQVKKDFKKYNIKSYEEEIKIPSLSNAYMNPMRRSGNINIPIQEYETIKELKDNLILSSVGEKFEETIGKIVKQAKSELELEYLSDEVNGNVISLQIYKSQRRITVSYNENVKKSIQSFKKLLTTDSLIGTKGGNKSHSRQRMAPIFITALPEYFNDFTPNFLERHVHDCCVKSDVNHIIFIMIESIYLEKAQSFLNQNLNLLKNENSKKKLNYVFISIDTELPVNIGKKKKLCMLMAEHFELEIYHLMEDNILHVEEYIKPIFFRHDNALARYLIYAEAILYFELYSSMDYNEKKFAIKEIHDFIMDEPLTRHHYLKTDSTPSDSKKENKVSEMDPLRKFSTDEKIREKCVQDPRLLLSAFNYLKSKLNQDGLQILQQYEVKFNEKFNRRDHVGHVSLWNIQSPQSKSLSAFIDSTQKTTHFVSPTRGSISTFYSPNMKGIHPVSDQVLFDEVLVETVPSPVTPTKRRNKGDFLESYVCGNSHSDDYYIRQMLLHGIGGVQIYAFRYLAGNRVKKRIKNVKRKDMDSIKIVSQQKKKK